MVAIFSKCHWNFIFKLQEILINKCNGIIVQTFKIVLRMAMHFEVKKQSTWNWHFSIKIIWSYIYSKVSIRGKITSFLSFKTSCERTIFSYWNGINVIAKKTSRGTQWHLLCPS